MSLLSPIHHTFGPLADRRQRWRALGMLLIPWKYRHGESVELLQKELSQRFRADTFLFSSGRIGLMAMLRTLQLQRGDEVIVQGYTCVVVPNAIHAAGGTPVFVDIDRETLNLDLEETRKAITPRTRAIICQHTFGIPSQVAALRKLCDEHKLVFIEDCAHVLPDDRGPYEIGKYGDVLLFSFGRDKAISGVSGGAILSRNAETSQLLAEELRKGGHPSRSIIARLMLYPWIYAKARPFYGLGLGKAYLKLCRMLRFLVPILADEEKEGHLSPAVTRMPNACAFLALDQWRRLQEINDHRRMLTNFYLEQAKNYAWLKPLRAVTPDLPLQKFPLFLVGSENIRKALTKHNIHLDDGWTGCVICPASVNMDITNYRPGNDPCAEDAAERILNLPTHPGMTIGQAASLLATIDHLCLTHP